MGWPVEWLKRMMSAEEFDMWCRYYRERPFDDESVHHVPIALLTSTYVNAHIQRGKPRVKVSDFLVFRQNRETSAEDLSERIKAAFAALPQNPA